MTNMSLMLQSIRCTLAAAACLVPAGAASASESQLRIIDHPLEQRMVITVAPVAPGAELLQVGILPRRGILYRISIELPETADPSSELEWSLVLSGTSAGVFAPLARFGSQLRQLMLPRPFGFGVAAGDLVHVHLQVHATAAEPVALRIVLDYEVIEESPSRLAIVPVQASASDSASAPVRGWLLVAPVGGRVLALAGLTVIGAGELILEDVETGAVVWRETVQPGRSEGFGGSAGLIRGGFSLDAGRTYRLRGVATPNGPVVAVAEAAVEALLRPVPTYIANAAR
jgi:hypothetical protein